MTRKTTRNFLQKDSISPYLFCPICIDIFDSPTRARCGHTFCLVCIQQWLQLSRRCPECKAYIRSGHHLSRDLIASKMINDLLVACVSPGCKWIGKNSQLKNHNLVCEARPKKRSVQITGKDVIVVDSEQKPPVVMDLLRNEDSDSCCRILTSNPSQ